MQFSVLRSYAATRFRDTGNVVVLDTDWKNYINDVYGDVLSRCTYFPWNEGTVTLTFAPSTRAQPLPLDVWQVTAVWDQTNQFPLVPLEGRNQVYQEYPQQTEVGIAQHYRIFNKNLQIYPLPAAQTLYTVEHTVRPTDLVADADLPVFPAPYHEMLVDGAVALAYRDDGNLQMSAAYQSDYEEQVKRLLVDLMQPRNDRFYEPTDSMGF